MSKPNENKKKYQTIINIWLMHINKNLVEYKYETKIINYFFE